MNYDANSIETLNFREAIRSRVAMYMGSADNEGVIQCVREIVSNVVDEFMVGYGDKVLIELYEGNQVKITDWARGIPFGRREDGTEALEAVFMTPHSGGKFNEKQYQSVIGMNGIGGKGVALSALSFSAESRRDGEVATLVLHKGEKVNYSVKKSGGLANGTTISFAPDPEVYHLEPIHINFADIKKMCRDWSYLNKGLRFDLVDHLTGEKATYLSKNGLLDLLDEIVDEPVHNNPIYHEFIEGAIKIEIAAQWTRGKEQWFVFTNGLNNPQGGTSLTGIRSAITRNVKKICELKGEGEMVRTGMVYAISCKIPNPSFANQTKTKINNPELRGLADKAFTEAINLFKEQYPVDMDTIGNYLDREQRAEAAAQRARNAELNKTKEIATAARKKVVLADKLKDCEKHGENSTLVIVEGDSAAGTIQAGRDVTDVALMPIKGKIINALKNPMEDVLENDEVRDILIALGAGIKESYSSKKLRFGKVAIATDGDADGYNIMCLIVTLFYVLMPKFIEEGRLVWLRAPLYKMTFKGKVYFAYSDEELEKIKKKNGDGDVQRFKGLGELNPDDVRASMFGTQQRVERLLYGNKEKAEQQLEVLMGKKVENRREFIMNNINFEMLED